MSTNQTRIDDHVPHAPSFDKLKEAEEHRRWAIEFVESYFRLLGDGVYEVRSRRKDCEDTYKFNHYPSDEVQCRCWQFKKNTDCYHASAFRLARGLVKIIELKEDVWKAGQVVLIRWMMWFKITEDNPMTSRAILNLILNDGTMMKVQSLRSRLTELSTYLRYPLVSMMGKRPYYYYLNEDGIKYAKEKFKGSVDPIGSL